MGISKTTAHHNALAVPEILNLILEELDMKTLLVSAQRVCHLWRTIIEETPSLQQKLFLEPRNAKINNEIRTFNPLLATKFPTFIPENERSISQPVQCVDLSSVDFIVHPEKQSTYLRPDASWRHMLTQQPPAFKLASITRVVNSHGVDLMRSKVPPFYVKGLRMGALFDWTLSNPGFLFTRGVTIFHGGASPVNTPFFNSGGVIADKYQEIVAENDVILSIERGVSPEIYNEMGVDANSLQDEEIEDGKSVDAITRDFIHSAYREAGLPVLKLPLENYDYAP